MWGGQLSSEAMRCWTVSGAAESVSGQGKGKTHCPRNRSSSSRCPVHFLDIRVKGELTADL